MSITGNHFGKKFVDLDEQLNSPSSSVLRYHEFELVPRMRETFNYGQRPNPNWNTLYNPGAKMNNYQTDGHQSGQDDPDETYNSNDNMVNNINDENIHLVDRERSMENQ